LASSVVLWNQILKKLQISKGKWEFITNNPENPNINYHRNPISGVKQLDRLMNYTEKLLESVQIPALVIQGSEDPVVNPISGEEIYNQIGSLVKELRLIPAENHVIVRGTHRGAVFSEVKSFLSRYI
jgi:esterase/lipase